MEHRNRRLFHRVIICLSAVAFLLVAATVCLTVQGNQTERTPAGTSVDSSLSEESSLLSVREPESSVLPAVSSVPPPVSSSRPVSSGKPEVSSHPPVSSLVPADPPPDLSYQKEYPELYVPQVEKVPPKKGDRVVYLTFDDGPSSITPKVLDVLDEYDVKATFFLIGRSDDDSKRLMKDIVDRGHAVGVHSYTHEYKKIYASPSAFLEDFSRMRDLIMDATGVEPTMFRFAGGSINSYNKKIAGQLIDEMTRRGYTYYDWNVSSGDAEHGATKQSIYRDTVREAKLYHRSVVLCHDSATKHDTVAELPAIIKELKKSGYRFDKLDPSVKPIVFKIP